MRTYFDASVIVPFLVLDPFNAQVIAFLGRERPTPVVSDFAAAEVSSAIARKVRVGDLSPDEARAAFAKFDLWRARESEQLLIEPDDIRFADQCVRRLDLPLRAPDAIHIAAAIRLAVPMASLDNGLLVAAQALGCSAVVV